MTKTILQNASSEVLFLESHRVSLQAEDNVASSRSYLLRYVT
jgi:hypothetical protein